LGKAPEIQALWESAHDRGLDVLVDNDVHTDFGPPLSHALPQWTQKLRTEDLVSLLHDPAKRNELREEVHADRKPAAGYVGLLVHDRFDRIWLLRCPHDPAKEGLTIAGLAVRRGVDPWNAYFDVIVEEQDRAVGLFDYMDLEEIKSTLRHPLVMICSDGWVAPKEERTSATAPYQPCTFGEFPGGLLEAFRDASFGTDQTRRTRGSKIPGPLNRNRADAISRFAGAEGKAFRRAGIATPMVVQEKDEPVSDPRIRACLFRILARTQLCSIATVARGSRAHINTAFFAYSAYLALYFLS